MRLRKQTMQHFFHKQFILHFSCPVVALTLLAESTSSLAQVQPPYHGDGTPVYLQRGAPVEQRIADLVDRMSLEEKARQLDLVPVPQDLLNAPAIAPAGAASTPPSWATPGIGAILINSTTPAAAIRSWLVAHARLGIPPLILSAASPRDGSDSPVAINLSATWNVDLVRQAAYVAAAEQNARGINTMVLPLTQFTADAPDIPAGTAWLAGEIAAAYVQGLQRDPSRSVAAIPGLFPLGVFEPADRSREWGERYLRMNLLQPFEPILRDGSPIGVATAPGEVDGVPITTDSGLLRDVLRSEWNFDGFTLAAPGSIRALSESEHSTATPTQAICQAINSGIDMQWNDYDTGSFVNAVSECVRDGVISMEVLNRAVGDVLRSKFRMGLFDNAQPVAQPLPSVPDSSVEVAAQSLTLLRNEHHLLPFSAQLKSLLVVEPPVADSRSGQAPAPTMVADEIRKLLPQTQIVSDDAKDKTMLAAHARGAAAVVVVLCERAQSGTAFLSSSSSAFQGDLVKSILAANPNTAVVLENTDIPSFTGDAGKVPAILEAWSPGKAGSHAIAAALAGVINPAGRLPMSIPESAGTNTSPGETADNAHSAKSDAEFPFGFGLSYTTFHYSHLEVGVPDQGSKADLEVTVTVTNTGKVEGDEVAQLYLHHDLSSVRTTDRALVGFQRIHLHPEESKTLTFKIPQQQLAVWNAKRQWSVEPGPYTLFAGGSSAAPLSAAFVMGQPAWAHTLSSDSDHWIFAPTLETNGSPAAEFTEAYQLAIRVMEYNLRDGLLEAGKGYGTWTRDTSINAWNAASLLIPDVARRTLWHETYLTPDGPVVGGQYWDKVIWIIAARNYVQITGDQPFLATAYGAALRTLAAMRTAEYDPSAGLFRGPAVYGDGVAAYPDPPFNDKHGDNVLDYTEGAKLETLSTNSVYYGAYRAAAAMGRQLGASPQETALLDAQAANLRQAIQHALWIANADRFAYFRTQAGTVDITQEALGEALAVTLGVATDQQAHILFRHAAVTPWGIACTWRPYNRYLDPAGKVFGRHNGTIWPFINAFWATAAASVGESSTFAREFVSATKLALRSEDFREIYHPYTGDPYGGFQANKTWDSVRHQTWSATGYLRMVYQGLFGMRFEEDSLRFQPSVPASLGLRSIALHGLNYRQSELSITVRGTGSKIVRCRLDGVLQQTPTVPANLTGKHDVEIVLAGPLSPPPAAMRVNQQLHPGSR